MIKRLLLAIFVVFFSYISLYIFLIVFNIVVFVIKVENFPGGTIELDKETRIIAKKKGIIIFIDEINGESDAVLKCGDSIDRDGYISHSLYQIIFIEVNECKIVEFEGYDLIRLLI